MLVVNLFVAFLNISALILSTSLKINIHGTCIVCYGMCRLDQQYISEMPLSAGE